jgi:hypothetical protein
MTFMRSTESAYRGIEPRDGGDDRERDQLVVTAMFMLDVLMTIKMELARSVPGEAGGAVELRNRSNRVEAAISDLKRIVGAPDVARGVSAKTAYPVETLRRAPVSER